MIDVLFLLLIHHLLYLLAAWLVYLPLIIQRRDIPFEFGQYVDLTLIPFVLVYYTLSEGFFGSSLGKFILGLRVIQLDGSPCTIRAAFVRAVFRYLEVLSLGLIPLISMKPPLQQRLGDRMARTVVVKANSPIIKRLQTNRLFVMTQMACIGLALIGFFLKRLLWGI